MLLSAFALRSGCSAAGQGLANRLCERDYPRAGWNICQTLEQRLADLGYVHMTGITAEAALETNGKRLRWVADGAKNGAAFEVRYDFLQNLQPLSVCLRGSFEGYASHVSAGMGEALDEPNLYRRAN